MKIKKILIIVTVAVILIGAIFAIIKLRDRENIDDVKTCAINLYQQKKNLDINFSSQCLGTCNNYAIDIVHVPRTSEDNLVENQCEAYRQGLVSHFILKSGFNTPQLAAIVRF